MKRKVREPRSVWAIWEGAASVNGWVWYFSSRIRSGEGRWERCLARRSSDEGRDRLVEREERIVEAADVMAEVKVWRGGMYASIMGGRGKLSWLSNCSMPSLGSFD